ncbi:hypothetical protein ES703_46132 [subsurface metagenome]
MFIHEQISFPLLKKLAHLGNPITKKAFKERDCEKNFERFSPVLIYLIK